MAENSEEPLCHYIEILSCSDLMIRDRKAKSSDPYVKVKLAGKDIHSTKTILKSLNPVFTDAQNNAFLLDCSAKELFDSKGLLFKVKDWNRMSADQDIGSIVVPAMELYKATGEVQEYELEPPSDVPSGTIAGKIKLRCFPATEAHLEKLGRDKKGLRGFVSGIQQKVQTGAQDITQKATAGMKDLGQKVIAVPHAVKDVSQAMTPTFLKKEDDSVKPTFNDDKSNKTEIIEEHGPDRQQEGNDLDDILMVVEIVAARDLLIADKTSSDPYVKVTLGEDEIHKTKHLTKTLNPIFKPELLSTFLLDRPVTDLSDVGLKFIVKDWDRVGTNDELGTVEVGYPTLVRGTGDATEFQITPPKGVDKEAGYLLLRFRKATNEDVEVLKDKRHPKNLFSTTTQEATSAAWAFLREPEKDDSAPELNAETNTRTKLEESVYETTPDMTTQLHLKVEIVSCRNLLVADKGGTSDPYVKVQMGGKDMHKTKHILKTLNPVFTEETHSTFVVHCMAKDLYDAKGLLFQVNDWDRIGSNDELGSVQVSAGKLYNSTGQDREFKITPPKGKEFQDAGTLVIRCSATSADDHTGEKKKFLGMTAPRIEVPKITVPNMKPVAAFFSGQSGEPQESKPLFFEIVSCRKLLGADKTGLSDPYVSIRLGKEKLHETKHVPQTLEPIFEVKHSPYYVLEKSPAEVKKHGGILFKVKDYDLVGTNDDLGEILVDPETLYASNGEKVEFKLNPPKGHAEEAGFITLRIRPATEEDKATKKSIFGGMAAMPKTDYGPKDLALLMEIVSCWDLPIADLTSTDPYIKVRIGQRPIHKTKPVKNTRDPIFTIKHDSVFILDVATKEIKEQDGITFEVMDYDFIGKNDLLGSVVVPADKVLEASGERLELQVKHKGNDAGWLAIRVRPATNYDREFLECLGGGRASKNKDFLGLAASYDKVMSPPKRAGKKGIKDLVKKRTKLEHGVKKYLVRPYPDPERTEATEFMSEKEIETEALKDSTNWLDIGSGDLGKVYVEIIGVDGLPNKDASVGTGNKTDPFVCCVYEDCVVKTNVIDDCLSPRWLPWTQRAFVFRMFHPSSNLHIAVFDYDPGFHNDHDMCGRVSIDLANFLPDTQYLLRYKIYESSALSEREPQGILMVRLRMELKPEKERIMSYLKYPGPVFYLNVKDGKDFDLVRQTVGGRHDMTAYSTKTISLYVEELTGHSVAQYYLMDAIVALFFWRGQVKFFGIWVPLHSMALWMSAIILAERPTLYPAFFFFFMGWTLLAVQYWRHNSVDPWKRSKTFLGLCTSLTTGIAITGPSNNIPAHYLEEESKAEEKLAADRIAKAKREAEERQKAQMKLLEEHESQLAQVGDQTANTDIATGPSGVSLDPLKFVLYPLQQYLALTCKTLRFVRNVVIWDEPYIAFILTFAFFGIGFVLLFVPWMFLFRWTARLVAWVLLGPHMRFADIYWYRKFEEMTEEERAQQIRNGLKTQLEAARALASAARIQTEDAVKLRDVKRALYGNLMTRVPVLRMERMPDFPLHSSSAQPYKQPLSQPRVVSERIPGQHLVGTMIPRVLLESDKLPSEDTEKEAKKNE